MLFAFNWALTQGFFLRFALKASPCVAEREPQTDHEERPKPLFFRSSFFAPHPFKGRGPGKGGGVLKLPLASRTPPLRWEGSSPSPFGEGVEGVLTCGVVGLYGCGVVWLRGCMVARLNVTHTEQPATCGTKRQRFVRILYDLQFLLVIICTFAPKMVSTIRKMKEI